MNTDKEMAELYLARSEGKVIQRNNGCLWVDDENSLLPGYKYRIKPKPFEAWTNIYLDSKGAEHSIGLSVTKEVSEIRSGDDCLRTVLLREVKE